MNVATATMKVRDVAKRAFNYREDRVGVSIQYVLAEIKRWQESGGARGLKADQLESEVGTLYWVIEESDFIAWEENRRPKQE